MTRRDFIKWTAVGAGSGIAGIPLLAETTPPKLPPGSDGTTVGLPISIKPLATRDLDPLFADMRERAGVNALFPFIYTHEPHRAGLPTEGFHGGNYATPHQQFYRDVPLTLQDMSAPEFGNMDVLARVIPAAQKHGLRTFCFLLEDNALPALVPNWEKMYEVDHHGRRSKGHPGGPCYNNPLYQNFVLGLVEDYARSYPIAGIMWGSERQSGLLNTLALSQSKGQDPGQTTCFCEFCRSKGKTRGIDVDRARAGFDAVEKFARAGASDQRPRDGYFTEFWRLLMNYPEVLAWENLWVTSRHEFQTSIYQRVKSINPALQVGWHVWHNQSFSPFQRAEEDFAAMTGYSDFIRPALYNNVAGGRWFNFIQGARQSVLGDLSPELSFDVLRGQLNYGKEAPYADLKRAGLSADYVERETRRAVDAVAGHKTEIWPGIDIDVPTDAGMGHCTPESISQSVNAVFRAGAQGIILSRNYVEMKPENLSGAGNALRELGKI